MKIEREVFVKLKLHEIMEIVVGRQKRLTVTGKFPTNIKQHLRKDHPTQYQEALLKEYEAEQKKKEESAKRASPVGKQLTVVVY